MDDGEDFGWGGEHGEPLIISSVPEPYHKSQGNLTRVESLHYQFQECCSPSQAFVHIRGHVTDSVLVAHDLFQRLFPVTTRWRIYEVTYKPPSDEQLASQGITTIAARSL
jgi:hypothetical protein